MASTSSAGSSLSCSQHLVGEEILPASSVTKGASDVVGLNTSLNAFIVMKAAVAATVIAVATIRFKLHIVIAVGG